MVSLSLIARIGATIIVLCMVARLVAADAPGAQVLWDLLSLVAIVSLWDRRA